MVIFNREVTHMLFRTKINIVFLALSIVGSHVNAAETGYVAQAKQKATNARDWSFQVAGKARKKAKDVYAFTRQKTNALYEKAKENKKLIAAAVAYLGFEAVGLYQGWRTPGYRLFVLPGELDGVVGERNAANATNVNLTTVIIPGLNGQLNTANADLNTANTVTIPGLQDTINANLVLITELINSETDLRSRNNLALDMLDAQDVDVNKLKNELRELKELNNEPKKPKVEFLDNWNPDKVKTFSNNNSKKS